MIYLGSDHRGLELKGKIAKWLAGRDYAFQDLGAYEYDHEDDYVDYAIAVAQKVAADPPHSRGIVICGSGVGVDIAANKVSGVRCGLGFSEDQVHAARKDDDINVLALAADNIEVDQGLKLIEKMLDTEFIMTDSHRRRLEKITRILERG
ncbi:MAG: RpiB/LacA/LacB family sugar-phosphate isomerase [bacterium]|nr:RpiB/LacA/LacB family sugar-phosphate isomerase [bacterium]